MNKVYPKFFKAFLLVLSTVVCLNTSGQIITTVAGNGSVFYAGDGSVATSTGLPDLPGITVDAAGNLYIVDDVDSYIRKVNTSGIITTIAGTGTGGFSGDGGPATAAKLYAPFGVTTDAIGNIFIADLANSRIRKINTSGIITTVAGSDSAGYAGDGGAATAARIDHPQSVAVDAAGNMYLADAGNSCIRKVTAAGIITTFAGTGTAGFSGDGGLASAAQLNQPSSVKLDGAGNVIIADAYNQRVRKVSPAGIITTIAGNGGSGFSGDGVQATATQLWYPLDVAFDVFGNMFISDRFNNRIRKVNTSGIISTYAGTGLPGFWGDGGTADTAQVHAPKSLATDAAGNLYIGDMQNSRVRKVRGAATLVPAITNGKGGSLAIFPNPNNGSFYVHLSSSLNEKVHVTIANLLGQKVKELTINTNRQTEVQLNVPTGIYFVSAIIGNEWLVEKIVVE